MATIFKVFKENCAESDKNYCIIWLNKLECLTIPNPNLCRPSSAGAGNPYLRGRLGTFDLLVLKFGSDNLYIENIIYLFYKGGLP